MPTYKIVRYMSGQSMKKWVIFALDKQGYVIMADPEHCMAIGLLMEDCYVGDIVEVAIVGSS